MNLNRDKNASELNVRIIILTFFKLFFHGKLIKINYIVIY